MVNSGMVVKSGDEFSVAVSAPFEVSNKDSSTVVVKTSESKNGDTKDFLIIRTDKNINPAEYVTKLSGDGVIDLKNMVLTQGHILGKSESAVINMNDVPSIGFYGRSGAGKSTAMKGVIYQLAHVPSAEFYIVDKDGDFSGFASGMKVRDKVDFKEAIDDPVRVINMLKRVFDSKAADTSKYASAGVKTWAEYDEKRNKELAENGGKTSMEFIPLAVVVLDEYPEVRKACSKVWPADEFDHMMESAIRTGRCSGIRILIGSQGSSMVEMGTIRNAIFANCMFATSQITNSLGISENIFNILRAHEMRRSHVFYSTVHDAFVKYPFGNSGFDIEIKKAMNGLRNG